MFYEKKAHLPHLLGLDRPLLPRLDRQPAPQLPNPCNPKGTPLPDGPIPSLSSGTTYYVDASHNGKVYETISIPAGATLLFKNEEVSISVNKIMIMGTLQMGSSKCPIDGQNKITINFADSDGTIDYSDHEMMVHTGWQIVVIWR